MFCRVQKKQQIFFGFTASCAAVGWRDIQLLYEKRVVALWAIVLLAAHLQRQAGLSTVGEAHLLAVDWLGWICYLFDKLEVVFLHYHGKIM